MSYQIVIAGHSREPHNDQVVAVAQESVKKLRALGHTDVHLSGYSNDASGNAVQLTDSLVDDDVADEHQE